MILCTDLAAFQFVIAFSNKLLSIANIDPIMYVVFVCGFIAAFYLSNTTAPTNQTVLNRSILIHSTQMRNNMILVLVYQEE